MKEKKFLEILFTFEKPWSVIGKRILSFTTGASLLCFTNGFQVSVACLGFLIAIEYRVWSEAEAELLYNDKNSKQVEL